MSQNDGARLRLQREDGSTLVLRNLPIFEDTTPDTAFSADGRHLFVLTNDHLWTVNVQTGLLVRHISPTGASAKTGWSPNEETCTLSPDGAHFITLTPRPTLFKTRTGHVLRTFSTPLETRCGGCGCGSEPSTGFAADSKLIWVAEDENGGNLAFWRVSDGKRLWSAVVPSSYEWLFTPDERYLAVRGRHHDLALRDLRDGHVVHRYYGLAATGGLSPSYVFSPDGKWVYTVDDKGRVRQQAMPAPKAYKSA